MKVFAVYANVELTDKPSWLDDFRKEYDEPWDFHVTLKQPCFIKESELDDLRQRVSQFFSKQVAKGSGMAVRFDEVVDDKGENDTTIMLRARGARDLVAIQEDLLLSLTEYVRYTRPHHQGYEENFEPHITIGRDLSDQQCQDASEYLKDGCVCEGMIREVILLVVKDDTVEEGLNPMNQTTYRL